MANELARYEADGTEVVLTDDDIRWVLAKNQNVTNEELKLFVELCVAHRLNPFIREAYIVKYGDQPASLLIGKDVWVKRAARNPRYQGHQAGVTFIGQDGKIRRREGSMLLDGEFLIGGWAKVYIKGYQVPLYDEVGFDEYAGKKKDGTLNSQWTKMPGTMIRKCALVHVLREAFPDEFGGCYDAAEMGVESPEYEQADDAVQLGGGTVEIQSDGGTVERIPVYEEPMDGWNGMTDEQKDAFVAEVAAREYEPTPAELRAEIRDMRKDYDPGWEAF